MFVCVVNLHRYIKACMNVCVCGKPAVTCADRTSRALSRSPPRYIMIGHLRRCNTALVMLVLVSKDARARCRALPRAHLDQISATSQSCAVAASAKDVCTSPHARTAMYAAWYCSHIPFSFSSTCHDIMISALSSFFEYRLPCGGLGRGLGVAERLLF
jgi:hypothetical protein